MTKVVVGPVQWSLLPHMESMDRSLSETDGACLAEIREVLARHDCLGRFGVHLLHRHFDIDENEVMLETVDEKTRTLLVRPVSKQNLGNAVQTQWHLGHASPLRWCEQYCHFNYGTHNHGHQSHLRDDDIN